MAGFIGPFTHLYFYIDFFDCLFFNHRPSRPPALVLMQAAGDIVRDFQVASRSEFGPYCASRARLQVLITDASSALYIATCKRACFQSVNILIPQSWNRIEANSSTWENFNVNVSSFHSIVMTWSNKCMLFFFIRMRKYRLTCPIGDTELNLIPFSWEDVASQRLHSFDAQLHNDCQFWRKCSQIRNSRLKYN